MKVYSVEETTKILKTSLDVVYKLIEKKMLVALKLKSLKVPEYAIEEFFRKYQFMDLSDLDNIKKM
ncbi:MAG: helix-turn-helix domain-containing protein [Clostridium perfringens]|nr:helix-turn-helix domain-containing protein [Clostridium perfringens]